MTLISTNPASTTDPDGNGLAPTLVGAASVHAALSDTSDSSYIHDGTNDSFQVVVRFGNPSPVAGAKLKRISLWVRGGIFSFDQLASNLTAKLYDAWPTPETSNTQDFGPSFINWIIFNEWYVGHYNTDTLPGTLDVLFNLQTLVNQSTLLMKARLDFTYVNKPVAIVNAPSGTLTTTNLPKVQWGGTLDQDGGPQSTYEVKVFTDDVYLGGGFSPDTSTPTITSGIVESANQEWQPSGDGLPDETYRAYVRRAQRVNGVLFWSDWAFGGFVVDVPNPLTPTLTVVGQDGRSRLRGVPGGGDTTHRVAFQRSTDGGATWKSIRTPTLGDGQVAVASGEAIAYDFEAPNGVGVLYRARGVHTTTTPHVVTPWTANVSGKWSSPAWWLKHPTRPELNTQVWVDSLPGYERSARQGAQSVLGRKAPVITQDERSTASGTVTIETEGPTEQAQLDALLDDGATLLLQSPPNRAWGSKWLALGNTSAKRLVDKLQVEDFAQELSWDEVEAPLGTLITGSWPT